MITVNATNGNTVTIPANKPITLRIKDDGLAGVSLRLRYPAHSIRFESKHKFDNTLQFPGMPVGTYQMRASIDVLKSPLGATYDSHWYVNGKQVADAHGNLGNADFDEGTLVLVLSAV